jgi:hypothetical protein
MDVHITEAMNTYFHVQRGSSGVREMTLIMSNVTAPKAKRMKAIPVAVKLSRPKTINRKVHPQISASAEKAGIQRFDRVRARAG